MSRLDLYQRPSFGEEFPLGMSVGWLSIGDSDRPGRSWDLHLRGISFGSQPDRTIHFGSSTEIPVVEYSDEQIAEAKKRFEDLRLVIEQGGTPKKLC